MLMLEHECAFEEYQMMKHFNQSRVTRSAMTR